MIFFLMFVRLRLGLFERDLADRFGVSVSTVSRICITWINFLYLKLKEIPMWPKKELVVSCMPTCFKQIYPTTRVIIDATEIPIETPSLPEEEVASADLELNIEEDQVWINQIVCPAIVYV